MTTKMVELFIGIAVVLLSYFICAPLVGYARAWAAKQMGDDTPEQMGFLTFNPFVHVSRLWLVIIVWLQCAFRYYPFGLGRYISINPSNIIGPHRVLRLACAYFADTVAAIIIGIGAFFAILVIHGARALYLLHASVTLQNFSIINPAASTFDIVVTWILLTIFVMATLMATFSLLINCFYFLYFAFFEDSFRDSEFADIIMLFGPLLLLYSLMSPVRQSIMNFVLVLAHLLAGLVGVIG